MKKVTAILSLLLLWSCSSTQLVSNWKNPDHVVFTAYKVLIVGMTQNGEARTDFESKLKREFDKRGVEAVRSIDLFDVEFTSSERSEEELDEVEQQLLDKDFDAILFTKVVGTENVQKFRKRMAELDELYGRFRDDYLDHQDIYYDTDYYDEYTVYYTEASLYCICVDKDRELIWRGIIEVTDPIDIKKTVKDYVKLLALALEEQDIIFRKEMREENESTSL